MQPSEVLVRWERRSHECPRRPRAKGPAARSSKGLDELKVEDHAFKGEFLSLRQ
ncbi:hypothetical protein Csa_017418 [Cucumis sativus]|uniref:Uncharacterized protein n=1 Tax=Cucumis sativus TaxID=3659 RepID=A0A0A0LDQ6_CUCSA|nr:hypothetical protein Csa_017418 [Cucumis sativus]